MPAFHYTATDAAGRTLEGRIEAADADEATARLEADGLRIESLRRADDGHAATEADRLSAWDAAELGGYVAGLTAAGLPLAPALTALAEDLPDGRLRRGLLHIADRLAHGEDLPRVLESAQAPADLRAILRAGVPTGELTEVLAEYIVQNRGSAEIRRRAAVALAYPTVLLVAGGLICLFVLGWIVPQFTLIYDDFGVELPALTAALIALSRLVRPEALWIPLVVIGTAVVLALVVRGLLDEAARRRVLYGLPMVGPLLRWTALGQFSHLLALLIEREIPLPQGLRLAGEGTADPYLQQAARHLSSEIERGRPLADSGVWAGFPAVFAQALRWEKHGRALPDALRAVGDMFQGRARIHAAFVAGVSEPAVIIFLGMVLGWVVIALFLPLITLLNHLS